MTKASLIHSPAKLPRGFLIFILCILSQTTFAGGQRASAGLSTGVAWSARNQALVINPSNLASGDSRLSLYGLYGADSENITGTFSGMSGAVGFGAGMVYNANQDSTYLAGLGFNLNALSIGASLKKIDTDDPTFNAGATLDLGALRLAAVFNNVQNLDRADFALGFMRGPIRFEFGVLENWPLSTKTGVIYTGLVYLSNQVSLSLGVYQSYLDASLTGEAQLRAGLEISLMRNISIDVEYNSFVDNSEYSAGLRLKF